jgi:hypothetical protein
VTDPATGGTASPTVVGEAVWRGALTAMVIVIPAAIAQAIVGAGSLALALFAVVLAGFGVGGYRAAGLARATPLTNAALAGLAAFGAAQVLGVAVAVGRGTAITWTRLAFLAMLATSCAVIGAWVRMRRPIAQADSDPE